LPAASLTWTVIVEMDDPLAGIEVGEAESVDFAASAEPGTTANVVTAVSALDDAVIVIDPASRPTTVTDANPAVEVFEPRPETVPAPDVWVNVTGEGAAVRFPVASRSSTVRILAAPDESGSLALVKRIAVAAPSTTAKEEDADPSPEDEAVTVTGPAPVPVTVSEALPPDVVAVPSPESEPLPADFVNEIGRPESPEARLPFESSTRTLRTSVPPAGRSEEADEKWRWCAAPATVVNDGLVPDSEGDESSVAVTV